MDCILDAVTVELLLADFQLRIELFTRSIFRNRVDKNMKYLCGEPRRLCQIFRHCAVPFFGFQRCVNAEKVVLPYTGKFGIGERCGKQPFGIVKINPVPEYLDEPFFSRR